MNFDSTTTLLIAGAAILLLLVLLAVLRAASRQSIAKEGEKRGGEPYIANKERPYMKEAAPPAPAMAPPVAGEPDVAQPAVPVTGDFAGIAFPPSATDHADELTRLKGVGPKLAAMLNDQGITRYEQLASMDDGQLAALDSRLGNFKGRLVRDRVPEQARYLASGDTEGFEATFGKLGG